MGCHLNTSNLTYEKIGLVKLHHRWPLYVSLYASFLSGFENITPIYGNQTGTTIWVGWLIVCLGLWHINLCRLFNAKSILKQSVLFQTIQFSMSTQFNCQNNSV